MFIEKSIYFDKNKLDAILISTLDIVINRADKFNEIELSIVANNGMSNILGLDLFK